MFSGLKDSYRNHLGDLRKKEQELTIPNYTNVLAIALSSWFAALTITAVILMVVIFKRLNKKDEMKKPLTATSLTDEEAAIDDLVEQLAEQVVDMDVKSTTGSVSTNSSGLGDSTENLSDTMSECQLQSLAEVHSPKC